MLTIFFTSSHIIAFCLTAVFFSGLGQTFIIAQYIPHIQADLNLSRSEISTVYSLATFLASLNLSYLGRLLDFVSLRKFTLVVIGLVLFGSVVLTLSTNLIVLFIGFYFLRGFAQMPLGLISSTTISKLFGKHRGKVLAFVALGKAAGEGVLPLIVVALITLFGWKYANLSLAGLFVLIMVPLSLWLIPKFSQSPIYEESNKISVNEQEKSLMWSWGDVFRHKMVLGLMFFNSFLPFVLTGLFFQQETVLAFKGWSAVLMAKSFIAYSGMTIFGNFFWGNLIDRFSAKIIQPFGLIPLIIALFLLLNYNGPLACVLYMSVLGLAMSLSSMIRNTYWAEEFGVNALGSLKGKDAMFLVIGTSISPTLFAYLLDHGMSVSNLIIYLIGLLIVGVCFYTYNYFYGRGLFKNQTVFNN